MNTRAGLILNLLVSLPVLASEGDKPATHERYDGTTWSLFYHCGRVVKVEAKNPLLNSGRFVKYSLADRNYGEVKACFNYNEAVAIQSERLKKVTQTMETEITDPNPTIENEGSEESGDESRKHSVTIIQMENDSEDFPTFLPTIEASITLGVKRLKYFLKGLAPNQKSHRLSMIDSEDAANHVRFANSLMQNGNSHRCIFQIVQESQKEQSGAIERTAFFEQEKVLWLDIPLTSSVNTNETLNNSFSSALRMTIDSSESKDFGEAVHEGVQIKAVTDSILEMFEREGLEPKESE